MFLSFYLGTSSHGRGQTQTFKASILEEGLLITFLLPPQIEILAARLKAKTAECDRTAKESDDKYRTLRQESQKQLHAFENEVRLDESSQGSAL